MKFDYEAITREFAKNSPFFADLADYRNNRPVKRFDLTDKVYFEYWGKCEWEFTIAAMEQKALYDAVASLTMWLSSQKVTVSRLPSLMAICKAKLMETA